MLLSTRGRYAVMAMVEVAKQDDAAPVTLAEIADRLELSLPYLEQLFMKLRRAGLVRSIRGPGGGYSLSRAAGCISIAEVMTAVEEPVHMTRCGSDGAVGCVASKRCSTHYLWEALGAHIAEFLASATLADVTIGRFSAPSSTPFRTLLAALEAR
jgi:Rrf2 family protein